MNGEDTSNQLRHDKLKRIRTAPTFANDTLCASVD